MSDQSEPEVASADNESFDPESPEALAKRLSSLKQARETVLGGIQASVGGAAEGTPAADPAAGTAPGGGRKEVTATTIGRMMGLVTLSEFKLVEGKIDLLSTRVNALFARLDKLSSILERAPTGSDLDRIDVQIGALKNLLKEALVDSREAKAAQNQERVSDSPILSNNE